MKLNRKYGVGVLSLIACLLSINTYGQTLDTTQNNLADVADDESVVIGLHPFLPWKDTVRVLVEFNVRSHD